MDRVTELLWQQASHGTTPPAGVEFSGESTLDSVFAVSEFAAASIAVAGLAIANLVPTAGLVVSVNRELACAWFGSAVTPHGWQLPSPWDAIAGDYETTDGWIRLHTNAPHHKRAALGVLGLDASDPTAGRDTVAEVVRAWRGDDLEARIVDAGGCAAVMRSAEAWVRHPQGLAVATELLIARTSGRAQPASGTTTESRPSEWRPTRESPLDGLRVLDLTRIIAGPVATRLLAGFGATVLRIDPPEWSEPVVEVDMTLGKRTARLDIATTAGMIELRALIADADVLVHGYRADALERLGLTSEELQRIRPGLVDVAINAYGFTGPWRNRRGFDSLVQMSTGLAAAGMQWASSERPTPLPVQALDHATGYLAAAAVAFGLADRVATGSGSSSRLSLARTAHALAEATAEVSGSTHTVASPTRSPLPSTRLTTPWGPANLLHPPMLVGATAPRWEVGPRPLGSDEARWP